MFALMKESIFCLLVEENIEFGKLKNKIIKIKPTTFPFSLLENQNKFCEIYLYVKLSIFSFATQKYQNVLKVTKL